jgi:hypothetical protein
MLCCAAGTEILFTSYCTVSFFLAVEENHVTKMRASLVYLRVDQLIIMEINLGHSNSSRISLILSGERTFTTTAQTLVSTHVNFGSKSFQITVKVQSIN